jgi:hypothetical protein
VLSLSKFRSTMFFESRLTNGRNWHCLAVPVTSLRIMLAMTWVFVPALMYLFFAMYTTIFLVDDQASRPRRQNLERL